MPLAVVHEHKPLPWRDDDAEGVDDGGRLQEAFGMMWPLQQVLRSIATSTTTAVMSHLYSNTAPFKGTPSASE